MSTPEPAPFAVASRHSSSRGAPSFASLAPDIQKQLYGRLGGMGLLYAGAWLANFIYFQVMGGAMGHPNRELFWRTTSALCIALGLTVYLLCRRQRISARLFPDFALGFEVLGGLGINAGYFGFEQNGEQFMERVAGSLGIAPEQVLPDFVVPIHEVGMRLLYIDGITWVAMWLVAFPLVVPARLGRTTLATLLTASTVPGVLLASKYLNGPSELMSLWSTTYIIEATVPTFICAGIAIYGASIMYKLTHDLSKARRMGSYQLVEEIGGGGMGEVWRAEHRMLARPAAIKFIRAEMLGAEDQSTKVALKRFEREVQMTTLLDHPNTITIFDYGRTFDGVFYYVMELLDGVDLETFVARFGPVPAPRVLHWLHQATGSLAEAHARGMTHRDIKPANLYTCRYGLETDFLKVLDFGLVKLESGATPEETRMTMKQGTTGTPAYMPPEMAMGEEADARSDIYSLGCVAYWLLTGETVFDGTTPMQFLVQHAKDEPIPPSQRTELAVPGDLEALVLECLEKQRDRRPESAQELGRRLTECADFGRWSEVQSDDWWRKHLPESAEKLASAERPTQIP